MRSKRKNIFLFLLFSAILGTALSSVVLLTASNLIHNKQIKQTQLVEQFTYSNLGDNAKLLSKQLRGAMELEFLTITDHNGNVLYRFIEATNTPPLITPILKTLSMYTKPASVESSNGHLHIEFHSSYDEFLRLFTLLLYFIFFAPSIILLLNSVIKVKSPLLSSNHNENSEHDQDKLTGLPSGPVFVEFFERLINDKDVKPMGFFVLIRASQLQNLNLNLGYPAGDKYIQLIGQAITTRVKKDKTLKAFKLNGFDFGIVLPNYSIKKCKALTTDITTAFSESFLEKDVSSKLGLATLAYDKKTSITKLLSLADKQAGK